MLMVKDGLDPVRHGLTGHIIPSWETERVISRFYKGVTPENIHRSLVSMKLYNALLTAPSKAKRELVYGILKATGNYKEMHGLLVGYEENPLCADSRQRLTELYDSAATLSEELISEFGNALSKPRGSVIKLNPIYKYTFGSKLPSEEN